MNATVLNKTLNSNVLIVIVLKNFNYPVFTYDKTVNGTFLDKVRFTIKKLKGKALLFLEVIHRDRCLVNKKRHGVKDVALQQR